MTWHDAFYGAYKIMEKIKVGSGFVVLGEEHDRPYDTYPTWATWFVDADGAPSDEYVFFDKTEAYKNFYARVYRVAQTVYGRI